MSVLKNLGAGLLMLMFVPFSALAQHVGQSGSLPDSGYVLGPDDQIVIHVMDAPEVSDKPMLIGTNGNITLPLIGRVTAGGLTVEQFETALDTRLKTYVKDPQVSVSVTEFRGPARVRIRRRRPTRSDSAPRPQDARRSALDGRWAS